MLEKDADSLRERVRYLEERAIYTTPNCVPDGEWQREFTIPQSPTATPVPSFPTVICKNGDSK